MNLINHILDFFLPRICISCQSLLIEYEHIVCKQCCDSISKVSIELLESEFKRKFEKENIITEFLSLYLFEKDKTLQKIIHDFKYNGNFKTAFFLGELVGSNFKNEILKWKADLIIPVPLHHLKKADRGYNQSYYISKGISKITGITVSSKVLKRIRNTPSQTELNLEERQENVRNAFKVKKLSSIRSKKLIIVDDVITTGATVTECGKELLRNGASKVYALSVALAE